MVDYKSEWMLRSDGSGVRTPCKSVLGIVPGKGGYNIIVYVGSDGEREIANVWGHSVLKLDPHSQEYKPYKFSDLPRLPKSALPKAF